MGDDCAAFPVKDSKFSCASGFSYATGERYQEWQSDHSELVSGSLVQAVYAYTGDIAYAQEHLCILSGPVEGIVTQDLKYPLANESLEVGVRNGCLNEAMSTEVSITHRSGILLLMVQH